MAKADRELTSMEVRGFTETGFYRVGGVRGLYLKVAPGGSRSWILRATVGAKRKDIGLGGFPDVTLQGARERAREHKEQIRQGVDPVQQKKALRVALITAQAKSLAFKDAAFRCHAAKASEFRNAKHKKDWISALERHAFPVIGYLPVSDIDLHHVMSVLEPIWHDKTETATRVRQRIEAVLTWSTVSGFRTGENPARWDGNLKEVLANPSKIAKVKHHAALPWQEVGGFMSDLRKRNGIAAKALEFAILTAARSGEVRGMEWSEIDFDSKVWTVPEGRIKAGRVHKVPLSNEALAILKAVPRFEGNPLVFVAPKGGVLSDVTLLAVVKRMGVAAVPHGFRSSFKDWARSCTAYPDEVSELALAHVNSDATRSAYARDELLPQRGNLMAEWAKFCGTILKAGDVVPMQRRKA